MIENLEIENLRVILDTLNNGEQFAVPAELSYSPVRSLAEVIAFNNAHPVEVSSNFLYRFSLF